MTPITEREVVQALRDCAPSARDTAGGWHASVVAARLNCSIRAAREHLHALAEQDRVTEVRGIGPNGARQSFLPSDHPDAPSETADDTGRVWVGEHLD
jgi:hypothetical protein